VVLSSIYTNNHEAADFRSAPYGIAYIPQDYTHPCLPDIETGGLKPAQTRWSKGKENGRRRSNTIPHQIYAALYSMYLDKASRHPPCMGRGNTIKI
jgi:hypothetical protein